MAKREDLYLAESASNLKYIMVAVIVAVLLLIVFILAFFMFRDNSDREVYESDPVFSTEQSNIENTSMEDLNTQNSDISKDTVHSDISEDFTTSNNSEDPQSGENNQSEESGAEVEISQILIAEGAAETKDQTIGIDVSRYQGNIDWKEVAAAGIDFAIIRVGYRTMESGKITEDSGAKYNLQEATANGIKVGAYFFSTAITKEEAVEEAEWTADFISKYKITYPVAYNCEGFENEKSRQFHLTKEERTELAKAFLNQIYNSGYTPMFYASKNELTGDAKWVTSELEKNYKIWLSWYPTEPYPTTPDAAYEGVHDMWQYTNNANLSGIDCPVDVNVAYFGYESENAAQNNDAPERVEADIEAGHSFYDVEESITAKESTNLRNIPSQGADSTVMLTLLNGQIAKRTGISDSGWSRVIYNGQVYYAVSSLLTTDLVVKVPEIEEQQQIENTQSNIQTKFIVCDENVMPKIEVNLRTIPSVTDPESKVVVTAKYGEIFKRSGINEEHGWSRVEYNGQTLYCVSSYIYVYEEISEE